MIVDLLIVIVFTVVLALGVSIILTCISVGLLIIYGADVAASQGEGDGFLPMDHRTRGMAIGGPSIILPIIAFFISRRQQSKRLGGLLIVSGGLVIAGGLTILGISDPEELRETGRNVMVEAGPLMAIGAFIVALGIIKLKQS